MTESSSAPFESNGISSDVDKNRFSMFIMRLIKVNVDTRLLHFINYYYYFYFIIIVQFAREEVDLVAARTEAGKRQKSDFEAILINTSRSNVGISSLEGFRDQEDEETAQMAALNRRNLINDASEMSRNVKFAVDLLSMCIRTVREVNISNNIYKYNMQYIYINTWRGMALVLNASLLYQLQSIAQQRDSDMEALEVEVDVR